MSKPAIIEIHLVPESKDVDNKRIEKEIKKASNAIGLQK
jgi:translation elongation factor EF-1beta